MWVFLFYLLFAFPGILGSSFNVTTDLHDGNATLFHSFDLSIPDFNWFFNEVEALIDFDFVEWYHKSLDRQALI